MYWCKSHYKSEFAKKKVLELRNMIKNNIEGYGDLYKGVRLVQKLTEYDYRTSQDETFYKIKFVTK